MDIAKLKGVVAPIVSPCTAEEGVDFARLDKVRDMLLATPISGLYINGGTGDGGKLTTEERKLIAEDLIPAARAHGKCSIVHVGNTSEREACTLAKHAIACGADAVASVPPRTGWNEIVQYYTRLTETGAPVIVYYIPGATGVSGGMPELRRLLDIPGVIGIKVSDYNIFLIRCIKEEYPDKVVYTGLDEMLVPGLSYGADGTIGTWINLLPEFYCKVYALNEAGEYDKLHTLSTAYANFLSLGWKFSILDSFQELMYHKDLALKCFREPGLWKPGTMDKALLEEMLHGIDALNELAAGM